jgi:hypothetical protein
MSLHLKEEYMHSLTEGYIDENIEWDGQITLLAVVD